MIPAEMIRSEPLQQTPDEDLEDLIFSITANGLLEPLIVRQNEEDAFLIVSGERRYRAGVIAGLRQFPCIMISCDAFEGLIFALTQQQTTRKPHYFEEANLVHEIMQTYDTSFRELSQRTGKSAAYLKMKLKLTELTEVQQDTIRENGLEETTAVLLADRPPEERDDLLQKIVDNDWRFEQAKEYTLRQYETSRRDNKIMIFKDLTVFTNTVEHAIDTMTRSGINASADREETENEITYTVTIQKTG